MVNLNMLKAERDCYRMRLRKAQSELLVLPEGRLQISRSGGHYTWRHYDPATGQAKYLPKREEALASKLAKRMYLEQLIRDDSAALAGIEQLIARVSEEPDKIKCSCEEEFLRLLRQVRPTENEELMEQLEKTFVRSSHDRGRLKVPTGLGFNVRSKSEAVIAEALAENGLVFMYEPIITIDGREYVPDFVIINPSTRQIFIWEHLGLMENGEYSARAWSKLAAYNKEGWILNLNLIVTTETDKQPFSMACAQKTIDFFFK